MRLSGRMGQKYSYPWIQAPGFLLIPSLQTPLPHIGNNMVSYCSLHSAPIQVSSNTECGAVLCHLGEGIKGEMSVHSCYRVIVPEFLSMLVGEPLRTRADFNRSIYCEEVVGSGAAETHGVELCADPTICYGGMPLSCSKFML